VTDLSLKVLHIRQSCLDIGFHSSASWAIRNDDNSEDLFARREWLLNEEPWSDTDPGPFDLRERYIKELDGADVSDKESKVRWGLPLRPTFRKFLDRIFGPQGIPSLQVVAFGDFSYRRRNKNSVSNLLFCKDGNGNIQLLKENSLRWKEILNEHRAALQSCPIIEFYDEADEF
jgi:hypothetical protein